MHYQMKTKRYEIFFGFNVISLVVFFFMIVFPVSLFSTLSKSLHYRNESLSYIFLIPAVITNCGVAPYRLFMH